MLLAESDIRRAIVSAQAAFPSFSEWEYTNNDEFDAGFSLWGTFVPEPNEPMSPSFFITFDTSEAGWRGHLTIGKHCYYWSSADCGDAYLLGTRPCATLDEAIAAIKTEIAGLFRELSGEGNRH